MSYPTVLCGIDGEPPTYVSHMVAATAKDAVAYAQDSGEVAEDDDDYEVRAVLMRELDPIACKIRGVEDGWWVSAQSEMPFNGPGVSAILIRHVRRACATSSMSSPIPSGTRDGWNLGASRMP